MFKDYDKYLSTSLKVYIFVLVVIFILKLVGLDYFGLDVDNLTLIKINDFCLKWKINILWNLITIYLQLYIFLCLTCNKKVKLIYPLIGTLINFIFQVITFKYNIIGKEYVIASFLITIILPMIIEKRIMFKRQLKYIILINIYQLISIFIRNIGIHENFTSFLLDSILNIDQLIMLVITYLIKFKEGEIICIREAGSSLLKKLNLKTLLRKLQRNLHKFKKLSKEEKLSIIIYIFLSSIWNIATIIFVLLVAKLNDTFIECLFILTSFWLSKKTFGKPFHLSSMMHCFIVSNATYYVLNRITTPLGISIFIPIMLGVGLSYVTSKLVKKTYKPLYKGMPKELFEETILKVVDKDSTKYKVCYEFYIEGKSDVSLSFKYNYSVAGIRKIKSRINDSIKELK